MQGGLYCWVVMLFKFVIRNTYTIYTYLRSAANVNLMWSLIKTPVPGMVIVEKKSPIRPHGPGECLNNFPEGRPDEPSLECFSVAGMEVQQLRMWGGVTDVVIAGTQGT